MKTIFVPSQRTRSPSHNCQSCNKSLCGTNEYSIGNETKLIGMLCQLDSIHPPFHTSPFICEVLRGSLSLSLSPHAHTHTHADTHGLILSPSLSISHTHACTQANAITQSSCGSYRGLMYVDILAEGSFISEHCNVCFLPERVSLCFLPCKHQ